MKSLKVIPDLVTAKNAAFRLLEVRPRSVEELTARLRLKNCPAGLIQETIQFLKKYNYLDDRQFAADWIRARLKQGYGLRRIEMELRQKGVDQAIIDAQATAAKDAQGANGEETLRELTRRRAARFESLDPLKRKKRLFDFLARRGFDIEEIQKAIKDL